MLVEAYLQKFVNKSIERYSYLDKIEQIGNNYISTTMKILVLKRKVRRDSVLEGLTAEQKERLAHWLVTENRGYDDVQQRAAQELGVTTSRSALSRYYRKVLDPLNRPEAEEAHDEPDVSRIGTTPAAARALENATMTQARHLAFRALANPQPDVKAATRLIGMVERIERRRIRQERAEWGASESEIFHPKYGQGAGTVTGNSRLLPANPA